VARVQEKMLEFITGDDLRTVVAGLMKRGQGQQQRCRIYKPSDLEAMMGDF
jgi:hypothetical protein